MTIAFSMWYVSLLSGRISICLSCTRMFPYRGFERINIYLSGTFFTLKWYAVTFNIHYHLVAIDCVLISISILPWNKHGSFSCLLWIQLRLSSSTLFIHSWHLFSGIFGFGKASLNVTETLWISFSGHARLHMQPFGVLLQKWRRVSRA